MYEISAEDALRFEVLAARTETARAQLALLETQGQLLREQVAARYAIDPTTDKVDLQSRQILRGAKE